MRFRSLLFVPGDRPDLAAKAPRAGADVVILDLEDAVATASKSTARDHAVASVTDLVGAGITVMVRINPPATPFFEDDVAALAIPGVEALLVPKLDRAVDVAALAEVVGDTQVVAGLETVRGVVDAREVLTGPVAGCYFGAEDYVVDLGGVRTEHNAEVVVARSLVAMAARVAGVPAFDQVVLDFHDAARFSAEASAARALGYSGKLCIHPAQVALANESFMPSGAEVERAERLLAAYDEALAAGRASCAFDGTMVDEAIARQARAVLATAGRD